MGTFRYIIGLLTATLLVLGCTNKRRNIYDERQYNLIRVDSLNGKVGTKLYVYKFDISRKLQIDYWGDGRLMAKSFSHNGKLDGISTMYDTNGINIMVKDSFKDGIKLKSVKYH